MRALPLLSVLGPTLAFAQAAKPDDPLVTQRPDFTETAELVPVHRFQIESGLTRYGRTDDRRPRVEFGESELRYGLSSRVEVRFDLPTYALGDDRVESGWTDSRIAGAFYLGQVSGFDLGIIAGLDLPDGTVGVGEGLLEPEVNLAFTRELGRGTQLAGTLGVSYARRDGEDASRERATLSFSFPLAPHLSGFVEYAGQYSADGRPSDYAHTGVVFTLGRDAAIDLHLARGLNRTTEQGLIGAGYSVRF